MFLQLFSKKVSFIHHEPYYYLPKTPIKETQEQTDIRSLQQKEHELNGSSVIELPLNALDPMVIDRRLLSHVLVNER